MPKYNPVDDSRQLPLAPTPPPAATVRREPPVAQVAITTTLPAPLRRQLTIALAVHEVKLKDAVAEAIQAWLEAHPVKLD
ncbi:hypothetical protein ACIQWR_40395 [Streptomyces sp. NPDC098789]|uniref:hypothetical protein n=1 Tax=Streptomyces sp. NPDC098789 TaxID=3366098 RepID=UPI003803DEA2